MHWIVYIFFLFLNVLNHVPWDSIGVITDVMLLLQPCLCFCASVSYIMGDYSTALLVLRDICISVSICFLSHVLVVCGKSGRHIIYLFYPILCFLSVCMHLCVRVCRNPLISTYGTLSTSYRWMTPAKSFFSEFATKCM